MAKPPRKPFRLFVPILAGATWRDRLVGCAGAMVAVALTALVSRLAMGGTAELPFLVGPVAASAVLLFLIPSSPLAQPWPIVGGNVLSAAIGIAVARLVPDPIVAPALALALALIAMSLGRCLHPPGGAAALIGALGSPAVAAAGFSFVVAPVALNAILLTLLGWGFHRFSGHRYPHRVAPAAPNPRGTSDSTPMTRIGFNRADIDGALADFGEAFDINRADLDRLMRQVELRALERTHGALRCADIMSRDVIRVDAGTDPAAARRLLIERNVRLLPVVDEGNRVLGCVGLRELERPGPLTAIMSQAVTARADTPAIGLIPPLTSGTVHAVVITDDAGVLAGVVTQTDLLAALARAPV